MATPALAAEQSRSAVSSGSENIVLHLLIELVVILVVTRLVVLLVRRLGQTAVSGEILAGLLLGPSLLGALFPGLMHWVFAASTSTVLTGLAQLGLILLMFQIGLEFDFSSVLRTAKRTALTVSALSTAVPFALGYLCAPFLYLHLPETVRPDPTAFRLFFGVSLAITAIPILGRIFLELGLSHTRLSVITLGSASISDVTGWLLLGTVALIVQNNFSPWWLVWHVAALAAFLTVTFLLVRPLLDRYLTAVLRKTGGLTPTAIPIVLAVLFTSAIITSNLGVFAIIGGFVIGVALQPNLRFAQAWKATVSPLVYALLLPLFFVSTGLRTDVGSIGSLGELGIVLLVLLVAFGGKLGSAYVGGRLAGEDRLASATIAVAMNTRALMELIVLNIGLEIGVLPPSMFTKLVLMAVVSTFIATPLIGWLMRGERRPVPAAYGVPRPDELVAGKG